MGLRYLEDKFATHCNRVALIGFIFAGRLGSGYFALLQMVVLFAG